MNKEDIHKHFPNLYEPALLEEIETFGQSQKAPAGSTLMDIGKYIKSFPLLISGSLKIMREDENGNEILLYYLEAGKTCAMALTCCMKQEKSNIRAVVEEDAEMIMIPVQYSDEWVFKYKSWKNFITETYADRFDELLKTIDSIAFKKMDERLLKYLKDKARVLETNTLTITHQDIAKELNSSREVISRLLKKLEQLGEIKLGRNQISLLG